MAKIIPFALLNAIACSSWFSLTGASFSSRFACQSSSPEIHFLTRSIAASCKSSAGTVASTKPSFNASSAFFGVPVAINSSALSIPMIRVLRTVPPKPGKIPNWVSGRPMMALSLMTRYSQTKVISQPPPSAAPLIAATFGNGKSSKRLKASLMLTTQSLISLSGFLKEPTNSVISAPAINTPLLDVTIRPFTLSAFSKAVTASPNCLLVSASNLFTLSFSALYCMLAMPSSSIVTVMRFPWYTI